MPSIASLPSVLDFGVLYPGNASPEYQAVTLRSTGPGPVEGVTFALESGDKGFAIQLMTGRLGAPDPDNTPSGSLTVPPASVVRESVIQVSFVAPLSPLPGRFTDHLLIGWEGAVQPLSVELTATTAELRISVPHQPIELYGAPAGPGPVSTVATVMVQLDYWGFDRLPFEVTIDNEPDDIMYVQPQPQFMLEIPVVIPGHLHGAPPRLGFNPHRGWVGPVQCQAVRGGLVGDHLRSSFRASAPALGAISPAIDRVEVAVKPYSQP